MKIICFTIAYFIIIYLLYYFFITLKQRKKQYRRLTSDAIILRDYYKINLKKIGYKKVYRLLNFVNAFLITFILLIIINIDNYFFKLLVATILILPIIWFGYYVLALYLKKEEKKNV